MGIKTKKIIIDEDLAYLAGITLTDGHIMPQANRFEISSITPQILQKVNNICNKFGWTTEVEARRILIYGKNAVNYILALGILPGNKSLIQTLPHWVGAADYGTINAFIAGVIDGDGCISKNNTKNRITTGSYDFAVKMSALLNGHGISSSVSGPFYDRRKRKITSKNPCYKINHQSIKSDITKFLIHPEKIERSKIIPRHSISSRRVKSVSNNSYRGYFYDFTVETHHNYIANGHFVSNTHVTGILCAVNNEYGMVGIAPKTKAIPVKVLDAKGSGNLNNVAEGIRWAADQGVDFITMSLGSPTPIPVVHAAIQYAASKGVVTFCAAGNAGKTRQIFYPAAYPETIGIGAIDENFDRANFSCTGDDLDFLAPGVRILSTVPDNWYAVLSGTCLAEGSYVYTPFGPEKIEKVKPGDIVFAWKNGEIVERPVLANVYRGKNDVQKVICAGRDVLVTETHKLLTINTKIKEIEWVPANELKSYHKLIMPRHLKTIKNEYLDNILNEEFCWLLGFFLGDGWLSDTKRSRRVQFATGIYPEIDEKVKEIYLKNTGKKLKESSSGWNYDDSTKTAMIIECLGLNSHAGEKTVPNWLWQISDNKINQFFNGYYSADGWDIKSKHKKFGFESKSKDLIRKIMILSDYMGWQHSSMQERTRKLKAPNSKEAKMTYSVSTTVTHKKVNGWSELKMFNIPGRDIAKKMGLNTEDTFSASWYKKEIIPNQSVYDLTVPDADCFITNGIITHNSMANPFAVGVACLLLSYKRKKSLQISLVNNREYIEVLKGYTIPSHNPEFAGQQFFEGFGIIDPRKLEEWAKRNEG